MARTRTAMHRTVAVLVAMLAFTGGNIEPAVVGASSSDEGTVTSMTGCFVTYLGFRVDAGNVSGEVPPPFVVSPIAPTKAGLLVKTYSCEALWMDGKDRGPVTFSSVGVKVDSPDGAKAADGQPESIIHSYTLWKLSDSGELLSRLRSVGAHPETFKDITFDVAGNPLTESVKVEVPWKGSPYQYSIDYAAVGNRIPPYRWTFWEGGEGRPIVRMSVLEDVENHTGVGTITTQTGTRLAQYLGSASAVAGVAEAKLHGTVSSVEIEKWDK